MKAAQQSGVALLTVLWVSAILSLLAASISQLSLNQIDNSALEAQYIRASFLHKSARRYAVALLLQPRDSVAIAGLPFKSLVYQNPVAPVAIELQNEAAFIDLQAASPELLAHLAQHSASSSAGFSQFSDSNRESPHNFRALRRTVATEQHDDLDKTVTFYSGFNGVNPLLANEETLALIPHLSSAEVRQFVVRQNQAETSLLSTPINNPFLHNRVSDHYRITTRVEIGQQRFIEQVIVKVEPTARQAYRVVARLR